MSNISPNIPVISTVNQFLDRNKAFTHGGVRSLIFYEELNGLNGSGAIIRVGRKILINEDKFFNWLESQNKRG